MDDKSNAKRNRGCTPHLFAILIFTILLLIVAKFTLRGLPENPMVSPTPSPQPKLVDVAIIPSTIQVSANEQVTFDIHVDTKDIPITAADITLLYDKTKLAFKTASPAAFFPNQSVFTNSIQPDTGRIHVALGSLSTARGSGTLFRISGNILPVASGSATILVTSTSRIGVVGKATSVLGETKPAQIIIF